MLSDILTPGDKIGITKMDKYGKPYQGARPFVSQFIDFVDLDIIQIATPIVSSKFIMLSVGASYHLCFYTRKGLYQGVCVVLKNIRVENTIVAVVRVTTNLEKYQRRQYYRLDYVDDIKYRVVTRDEEILKTKLKNNDFENEEELVECKKKILQLENDWIMAIMKDISGGGIRFISESVHDKGDMLKIELNLVMNAGFRSITIEADIISSQKLMDKPGSYEYRVEFSDIMKKDREDLVKYIFEQERHRRKNV